MGIDIQKAAIETAKEKYEQNIMKEKRKEKFDEIELKVAEHMQNNEYETAMMIIGKASALGFSIDIQKAAIKTAKEKYEQNIMKEENDKLKRDAEREKEEREREDAKSQRDHELK